MNDLTDVIKLQAGSDDEQYAQGDEQIRYHIFFQMGLDLILITHGVHLHSASKHTG